jgi:hypothetical protein
MLWGYTCNCLETGGAFATPGVERASFQEADLPGRILKGGPMRMTLQLSLSATKEPYLELRAGHLSGR